MFEHLQADHTVEGAVAKRKPLAASRDDSGAGAFVLQPLGGDFSPPFTRLERHDRSPTPGRLERQRTEPCTEVQNAQTRHADAGLCEPIERAANLAQADLCVDLFVDRIV